MCSLCVSSVPLQLSGDSLVVFQSMQSVLHSCLSTRVVLHLREINLADMQTSEFGPVSDVVFGRNEPDSLPSNEIGQPAEGIVASTAAAEHA